MIDELGLEDVRSADRADLDIDPHDPAATAEIEGILDRYAEKAAGIATLEEPIAGLRERLATVGVQEATILTLVGRRPAG